jgi:AP-3 complex subunit beta
VIVLDVLTRYIRTQFRNPIISSSKTIINHNTFSHRIAMKTVKSKSSHRKAFYSDDEGNADEEGSENNDSDVELGVDIAPGRPDIGSVFSSIDLATDNRFQNDHKIALKASLPLLKSRNSGVVLGVCGLHFYCGSDDQVITNQISKALVRILRNRREIQIVILTSIKSMVLQRPDMFVTYLHDFFIKAADPMYNR